MANIAKRRHSCTICGKYFYSVGNLSKHIASHSEDILTCNNETDGITIKCEPPSTSSTNLCEFQISESLTVTDTLPLTEPNIKLEQETENASEDNELVEEHLGQCAEKPLTCRLCHEFYIRKRRKYENDDVCDLCNKSLMQMGIATNLESRAKGKGFICDICGKRFSLRSNFVKHYRIHLNLRPYACDLCDRAFFQKKALIAHQLIHSGLRPHVCVLCGKQFTQKSTLRNHFFIHVEEVSRKTKIKTEPD